MTALVKSSSVICRSGDGSLEKRRLIACEIRRRELGVQSVSGKIDGQDAMAHVRENSPHGGPMERVVPVP